MKYFLNPILIICFWIKYLFIVSSGKIPVLLLEDKDIIYNIHPRAVKNLSINLELTIKFDTSFNNYSVYTIIIPKKDLWLFGGVNEC